MTFKYKYKVGDFVVNNTQIKDATAPLGSGNIPFNDETVYKVVEIVLENPYMQLLDLDNINGMRLGRVNSDFLRLAIPMDLIQSNQI